jgi:hypothetical protein
VSSQHNTHHLGGIPRTEPVAPLIVSDGREDRRIKAQLEAEAKISVCDDCFSDIWVAYVDGAWQLRCSQGFTPKIVKLKNQMSRRAGMALQHSNPDLPVVIEGRAITMPSQEPLSVDVYRERRNLITEVIKDMEENVDFGIIPGTHDKSLWEPGAERLRFGFNIQFTNVVVDQREDFENHEYYYRYLCTQLLGPGINGPSWEASAWSRERKFWCKGGRGPEACPNPCDGKHGPLGMEATMLSHNVRDRAQKRAFVAMIRNVTGATGLFKGSGADRADSADSATYQDGDDSPAPGQGNDHPWLVQCPVHKRNWMKSPKMREFGHPPLTKGGEFCNQSTVLKPMLDKQLDVTEQETAWDRKGMNEALKTFFDGTWSQLSPRKQIEAIEWFKANPPVGAAPVAANGAPVDTKTGAIDDSQAPDVEPDVGQHGMDMTDEPKT